MLLTSHYERKIVDAITGWSSVLSVGEYMNSPDADAAKPFIKIWYRLFLSWQIIHWILLLLVTAGSAIVASAYANPDPSSGILPLFVAVISAVYAVFNPSQRAEAYREAWLSLNRAVLLGKSAEEIVGAYLLGEEIIGRKPVSK